MGIAVDAGSEPPSSSMHPDMRTSARTRAVTVRPKIIGMNVSPKEYLPIDNRDGHRVTPFPMV